MKSHDFAGVLEAVASLSDSERARQLRAFAGLFRSQKSETITQFLKKMGKTDDHPPVLKASVESIKATFEAGRAKKQAADLALLLKAFKGAGSLSVEEFIIQLGAGSIAKPREMSNPRTGETSKQPDDRLARELADELTRTVLDTASFHVILKRLQDSKAVNSPTLAVIANRFLGNSKRYTGRKHPIEDIERRQKAEARENARGTALNRIGV